MHFMDVGSHVGVALKDLNKHKVLVLPTLLGVLVHLMLILALFQVTGFFTALGDVQAASLDYASLNADVEFFDYLNELPEGNPIMNLVTLDNLYWIIGYSVLHIVLSWYFLCVSFVMIARMLRNKDDNLLASFRIAFRYLPRFVLMHVLHSFLVYWPLLVITLVVAVLAIPVGQILLALGIGFVLFIPAIVWMIFAGLRLFFTAPAMFIEDKGPISSLKRTYHVTGLHLQSVFLIALICVGIVYVSNLISSQGTQEVFTQLLVSNTAVAITLFGVLILVFAVIESALLTLEHVYLMRAYVDYEKTHARPMPNAPLPDKK